MPPNQTTGPGATWFAFLAAAFLTVGLTGLFVTFAAPLTLERQAAREAALDQAALAARGPDPAASLSQLRAVLDDSAAALLPGSSANGIDPVALDARIAAERVAMRGRFAAENAATLVRLRWLVCLVTLMAACFGVLVLRLSARAA